MSFRIPEYDFYLPWFMFDLTNIQIITTRSVPSDIQDSKGITLTEIPIPGLNYSPIQPAGNANRKVSFTLPLVQRNNTIGNSLLLQQFAALRNQAVGLTDIFADRFTPNPQVLYYWGTGSVPLVYYVSKCDFSNKKQWINQQGVPQYSEVQMELILDENNILYRTEEVYRKAAIITQQAVAAFDFIGAGPGKIF